MRAIDLRERSGTSRPPEWVVDRLIPKGHVTLLFGRAGMGKTYLWLWFASHIAAGRPIFGRPVAQGHTLIFDAELDDNSIAWRAAQVARGMGLERPPEGLFYSRLEGSLSSPDVGQECRELVTDIRPELVVVDAISSAAPDSDPAEAVAARRVLMDLLRLGATVLAIDHVSKAAISRPGIIPQPIGSVAKENIMRAGIFVEAQRNGTLRLHQTKSTFGEREETPMVIRPTFAKDSYTLNLVKETPRESPSSRLLDLLAETESGSSSTDALVSATGLTKKTILNRLREHEKQGEVRRNDAGAWVLLQET